MKRYDIAVIGAGIAGASLAAELAPHARVLVLEMEDQPGYHSTGRSAAFWSETYGGPYVQPLTTASGVLLGDYLEPLGSLHIARVQERDAIDAELAAFAASGVTLELVDPRERIPGLRDEWTTAIWEPSCAYIDVGGLHGSYLKAIRQAGGEIVTNAALQAAHYDGGWKLQTRAGAFDANLLVNAAGAWADPVAAMAGAGPLGIQPYRRTMVQLRTDPVPPADLPHVGHVTGSFYFKPEAGGRLWLSPHDEIATEPCDAQPEEIDVAIAIDRLEQAVDWRIEKLEHKWAGLRSFAPDRLPVYGFDRKVETLFWCAGQGGFGIQTAPAAAKLAAAVLLGRAPGAEVAQIDAGRYSPRRL